MKTILKQKSFCHQNTGSGNGKLQKPKYHSTIKGTASGHR